jgi:thrombospondin type 3 repeat protein
MTTVLLRTLRAWGWLFGVALLATAPALAQPNDSCASPDVITDGGTPFDNTLATRDTGGMLDPIGCVSINFGHTLYYEFTPALTGSYQIDTCNCNFDSVIYLATGGPCGPFTQIACNDDGCGSLHSLIPAAPLSAGTAYTIVIAGYGSGSGSGTLQIGPTPPPPPPPANDDCETPQVVHEGSQTFTNVSATGKPSDPVLSCGLPGATTVWFEWVAPSSGATTIDTCGSSLALNTVLAVFTGDRCGSPTAYTEVACNDNSQRPQYCYFLHSSVTFNATALTTYRIEVDGFDGSTGTGVLNIDCINSPDDSLLPPTASSIDGGIDLWSTPASGATHDDFGQHPIPPEFFGPGSDPFVGLVTFGGVPLTTTNSVDLGPSDTIVQRDAPASLPTPGSAATIPIEIVALSLQSVHPITVTYGGAPLEQWNIQVGLSSLPQPLGSMTITSDPTGFNGGTFTSTLPVLPKLVFTRVTPPPVGSPIVLDFGTAGLPPFQLDIACGHYLNDDPGFHVHRAAAGAMIDQDFDPMTPPVGPLVGTSNFIPGLRHVACNGSQCQMRLTEEKTTFVTHGLLPPQPCFVDTDGDGIPDGADNAMFFPNALQEDGDCDGVGDVIDNCLTQFNPCQEDSDFDGIGDACDNCVGTYNPGQEDCDGDGIGDLCEPACIRGTVDVGPGGRGPAITLLTNGHANEPCFTHQISASATNTLRIVNSPSRVGHGSSYAVYAWASWPDGTQEQILPSNVGTMCMRTPISPRLGEQPIYIANNIGGLSILGVENWPGPRTTQAPFGLLNLPPGLLTSRIGQRFFFQGIERDSRSAATIPYSVTNGQQWVIVP